MVLRPAPSQNMIVRRPAVPEAVQPDAGQAAARELVHLVEAHAMPLVDHHRIERGVERAGAGGDVEERHRLVQVVHDLRVEVVVRLHGVLAEREGHADLVAVVVVRDVLAPVDERRRGQLGIRLAVAPEVDHAGCGRRLRAPA